MAVAHLALKPARIGGASTESARDLLAQSADPGGAGDGRVEMIERRIGPRFRRRGGEAALMLGEGVGVERVLAGQVLRMNESLGAGDPRSKLGRGFARVALAVIGVAGRGKISLRKLGPSRPLAPADTRAEPDTISAGRCAKYARRVFKTGQRIVIAALLKRGDCANDGGKQGDLAWKNVSEQAGNAQRHVDPRPAQHGERQNLKAVDASRRGVPGRPAADQRKSLRQIVAAGSHRRRAPKVKDDALRPFAMVLRVALADLFGRAAPDLPCVASRGGTRIDGVEIAAGRQNVEAPARRCASRPRRHETPAERAQQAEGFGGAAGGHALAQRVARRRVEPQLSSEAISALGRPSEYMQAVADAHLLEVAEPGVEGDERVLWRLVISRAFLEEAVVAAPFENERRDGARAARVKRLRLGEFIEQPFEFERCAMRPGGDQRRRQMADGDRADAALGLRRFARIVDNERIDDRRRAEQNFGRATLAKRDRLARQPFERPMRAKLNDRVDVLLASEPKVESDIGVARRQVEIVIVALAREGVAAVRLHGDEELAKPHEAELERPVDGVAVVSGVAPRGE